MIVDIAIVKYTTFLSRRSRCPQPIFTCIKACIFHSVKHDDKETSSAKYCIRLSPNLDVPYSTSCLWKLSHLQEADQPDKEHASGLVFALSTKPLEEISLTIDKALGGTGTRERGRDGSEPPLAEFLREELGLNARVGERVVPIVSGTWLWA